MTKALVRGETMSESGLKVLEGLKPTLYVQFRDEDGPSDLTGAGELRSWWCQNKGKPQAASHSFAATDLKRGVVGVVPDQEVEKGELAWFTMVRRIEEDRSAKEWVCMGFAEVVGPEDMDDGLSPDFKKRIFMPAQPQLPGPEGGYRGLKAVVMAWPRSGTTWISALLNRLGCPSSHEGFLKAGPQTDAPPQRVDVEVTGFAAPFTDSFIDIPRFLVVRHPAKLFGSIIGRWGKYMRGDLIPWLSDLWVDNMRHLRSEAQFVLKIEDLWENPLQLVEAVERLGVKVPRENRPLRIAGGQSTHTQINEEEITEEARELAREFGYDL